MNTRVKQIRQLLHMSQDAFAKRLGITAAGISKIESGNRSLTTQMLLMICREFQVNVNWLRSGEGEIFEQKLPDYIDQLVHDYQLDELDKKIILEYIRLDEHKRGIIKDYIMKLVGTNPSEVYIHNKQAVSDIPRVAEVPGSEYLSD